MPAAYTHGQPPTPINPEVFPIKKAANNLLISKPLLNFFHYTKCRSKSFLGLSKVIGTSSPTTVSESQLKPQPKLSTLKPKTEMKFSSVGRILLGGAILGASFYFFPFLLFPLRFLLGLMFIGFLFKTLFWAVGPRRWAFAGHHGHGPYGFRGPGFMDKIRSMPDDEYTAFKQRFAGRGRCGHGAHFAQPQAPAEPTTPATPAV
jgi:hypothetical protein